MFFTYMRLMGGKINTKHTKDTGITLVYVLCVFQALFSNYLLPCNHVTVCSGGYVLFS